MAKQKKRLLHKFDGHKQGWLRGAVLLVILLGVAFVLSQMALGVSTVSGDSMLPTLVNGKVVLYNRLVRAYAPGDIVAIHMTNGDSYVKRVIAVGGDTVDIRDGVVYVNGVRESGSYLREIRELTEPHDDGKNSIIYPYIVESGRYFVLGDNRAHSTDSRNFGSVASVQILGRLIGY